MLRNWRPWALALGIVVTLCAWGGGYAYRSWRFQSDLAAAKKAIAARSTTRAYRLLTNAVSFRPGDGEANLLLGACELSLGHPDAAELAWARVDSDSPFAPAAAMFRARAVLDRDRLADAEPLLNDALKGQGRLATEARETLVNLYKLQGRFDEARTLVSAGWGSYPDKTGLIKELENLGSNNPIGIQVAYTALSKAFAKAPDDDRIWLGYANLATRSGQYDEARHRLEACLNRRPDDVAIWRGWLSWAYATQDTVEVERALRRLPDDRLTPPEVLSLSAWFAARAGDVDRERRAYEAILAREPGSLRALERLADIALVSGQSEKAAALRARRAELSQYKHEYENALMSNKVPDLAAAARAAEALGRIFEAHSLWSVIARTNPEQSEARAAMARLVKAEAARPKGPTIRDLLTELDTAPKMPAAAVASVGITPEFEDAAESVGLRFTFDNGASELHHMPETTASGVGLLDFDGDGWLDVYLTQAGPFPPDLEAPKTTGDRLFHNRGDGTFEDVTESSGLSDFARGYSHGVTVGDFDNDGHPDLFVTRWRRYALYRNKGDGTFEDLTERAGLGGDRDWPTSAAFADLDNDGDLDLYVCHYLKWDAENPNPCWDKERKRYTYCAPQYFSPMPDHLFRNDDGKFVDVTKEAGIIDQDGRGLGVVASDLDGDGRVDLFVANDQSANYLFHNKGGMRFEEIGHAAGVACNADGAYQAGMGVACGDADGDGQPDLAVTNFYNEYTTLYRNVGGGVFTDSTAQAGLAALTRHRLGFGIAFVDANNDGRLDLATANGHVDDFQPALPYKMRAQLLIGVPEGRFVDSTDASGPPWQVARVARGLAVGDLDNDGRADLLLTANDSPLAYFHNRTSGGHWLTLSLEGTASPRDAIGARVVVTTEGRRLTSWRLGGASYQSASDPRLHFGLGFADRADQVEVTWPSGSVDRFGPLAVNTGYRLQEGGHAAELLAGFRVGDHSASRRSEQYGSPSNDSSRSNPALSSMVIRP
jgi:tetratricopeptide (TPR) repeat protein